MELITKLGFKIYRLKENRTENEFLLYNLKNNTYSFFNKKRCLEVLKKEIESTGIDMNELLLSFRDLISLQYSRVKNKETNEIIEIINVNKTIEKYFEKEYILINSTIYIPKEDLIIEKDNKKYFNLFVLPDPLKFKNYKQKKPISFEEFKKNAKSHYKLFKNLHSDSDEAVQNTLHKIAHKVQFPYEKSQDCIIFYPGEGAGKGIFYKFVLQPIFQNYASKILMDKLKNDFNSFLVEPLVLVIEEGKRDKALVEVLKELTTESTLLINEKGKPQIEKEIYFLTFVFSNHMNPLDLGKRRGSYHLTNSLGGSPSKSYEIGQKLTEELPKETDFLLKYLHSLEVDKAIAQTPFNTKAKEEVTELNKTPLELFYDHLLSYSSLKLAISDLHKRAMKNSRNGFEGIDWGIHLRYLDNDEKSQRYITKEIIKEAYNNFCNQEGFRSNLITHNKDIVQLWALFQVPEDAHKRILILEGEYAGRKLSHVDYDIINSTIQKESLKNE